jgi:23S rRNA (cytosine1962-C5)-methyltransferase
VDRYGDWLWAERAPDAPARDLPPARGVWLVESLADRSRGAQPPPRLLQGEPAPRPLRVTEHGVAFLVDLSAEQLSTGLFLDQRPQRAWLARHAAGMRVLNTFAHAGGFSVAAAVAGATTVSVDLSRRWLERISPQLEANGADPALHDRIYGDVFDWLRRLAKRGERFDLVILDPPGTSTGRGGRRWSAARDYGALAALAAPLVGPGGALWTACNVRALPPARFARLVGGGLPPDFALERVCPPPVDHPTDGPADVKTFVWRRD